VAAHPDLPAEQRYLDRAYRGLEAMRAEASRMLEGVLDLGRGGTFQSRTERDIVVRTSLARQAQLDIGDQALLFGRIDRRPEDGQARGESFHIGRLAVSGPDHEPLVVDWRAPVAEPFYRATGVDAQGLVRRRHLAVRGRRVTGLEDEYFGGPPSGAPRPEGLEDGLVLGGPGALLAALGEARTGQMGDIVATIQAEQDQIIRSPMAGILVVQGGPGTGKTAVALHRAAYLLYTHRFPLERQGVLVVGPNPLFLRYIEQVLPSLGETGVTLSTVSGLVPEIRVTGTEAPAVARLKGEARMARVLARAVRTRQRPLRDDVAVPFGSVVLTLRAADSDAVVRQARRRPGPHNARRRFVEGEVLALLADQYRSRRSDPGAEESEAEDAGELRRRLRRQPAVAEALDRMWPRLSPHELLHDLFGARPLLAAAGRGLLGDEELAALFRRRSPTLDQVAWTAADAALVDEARALLGPRRPRAGRAAVARGGGPERVPEGGFWPAGLDPSPLPAGAGAGAEPEEVRSFGHIVVDEAQDLSPMQLRMLARRSLSGSMTVVGDIAQATGPWAPADWDEVTRHLNPRRPVRRVELTVSYRTPAEVVAVARRVLAEAAPEITPPTPVRRSGVAPEVVAARPGGLGPAVAEAAARALERAGAGRAAVLAPALVLPELARALEARGLEAVDPRQPGGPGLGAPLVLLPVDQANGLEFDAVVVAEPALVAAEGADRPAEGPPAPTRRGLRTLYVALTRPTRSLSVVHSLPLPAGLAPARPPALV
jgi:DNA helicase IV